MCLRPMVRPPLSSASFSVVAARRVMEISSGNTGSTEVAKVICTGPRTWPALTPVVITAPNVRMSQKFAHIHLVSSRAFASSFGSRFWSSALVTSGITAAQPRLCSRFSVAPSRM